MDTHMKEGQVYLQPQKSGKKWKKLLLVLYPASRCGIARLELLDPGAEKPGGGVRRPPERRVLRLAECVRVLRLPPHAEACPGDNMAAFCVETEDRKYIFAVDKEECVEWVEKTCEVAFQGVSSGSTIQTQPQMEENQIYVSREEASEFWVIVLRTVASARCGLQGAYWLQVSQEELVLKEIETKRSLLGWPYPLLRRYGRDKGTFSIEAGRRCQSGPGTFNFETPQADLLFGLVETAIRKQKASSVAGETVAREMAAKDSGTPKRTSAMPRSPLPKRPNSADLLNGLGIPPVPAFPGECIYSKVPALEHHLLTPAVNPSSTTSSPHLDAEAESVYSDPADLIRPPNAEPHEGVYSDPADYIRPPPIPDECVYSDPAEYFCPEPVPHDGICLDPAGSSKPSADRRGNRPESPRAEERGKASPNRTRCDCEEEPIYSEVENQMAPAGGVEPRGRSPEGGVNTPGTDPPSAIYSTVCKPRSSPAKSLTKGQTSPDVIYENLGII